MCRIFMEVPIKKRQPVGNESYPKCNTEEEEEEEEKKINGNRF